jgi:hypothetical protein
MKRIFAVIVMALSAFLITTQSAHAFGVSNKFVLLDDNDASFAGSWNQRCNGANGTLPTVYSGTYLGECARTTTQTGGAATSTATYEFVSISRGAGSYSIDATIPDDSETTTATAVKYRVAQATYNISTGVCNAYGADTVFTVDQSGREGGYVSIGTVSTAGAGNCIRVIVDNSGGTAGSYMYADTIRVERLFENASTIPDMPTTTFAAATGNVFVTAVQNAVVPTTLTSLSFTCPANGRLLVTGSGEATIVSGLAGTGFAGLYFSLVSGSATFDSTAAWQMSGKFDFNGEAARQMVNAQKVFNCSAGTSVEYRLVATRRDNASTSSNVFNPTITAVFTP